MEIRFTYIVVHFVMMTRASSLLEFLSGESLGPRHPPPPPPPPSPLKYKV